MLPGTDFCVAGCTNLMMFHERHIIVTKSFIFNRLALNTNIIRINLKLTLS